MPIYEYACESCGHHLEVMQRLSEEPITLCPNCQKESLIRLISAAGFRLKGGGWYETDFKDNAKKKNLAGDSESPSRSVEGSQTTPSSTTDSKSANSSDASKSETPKSTSSTVNTETSKKGSNGSSSNSTTT